VAREVAGIAGSLQSDLEVARSHVSAIEASLARVARQARIENMARVKLGALEANLSSTRATYESFVTRLRAVQDQDDIQMPEARVISTAPIPAAPSSPHRKLFIGAAIPGGLLLGILLALILERFGSAAPAERPVRSTSAPKPAEDRSSAPIGAVPAFAMAPPARPPTLAMPPIITELAASADLRLADWVLDHPDSPYGQGLNAILQSLMAQRGAQGVVAALTSTVPDASQSVTALALARLAARSGLRTLLVDANFGRLAPVTAVSGMAAILNGTPLATAVLCDRRSAAYLLSAPPAVWGHPQVGTLLATLRQSCDLVLIDAAATGTAGVWPSVARLSDTILLMTAATAPKAPFDTALRSLVAIFAPLRGVVITR